MNVQERIQELIKHLKMNKNSFSISIGIHAQTLHHIISGRRTNPSFEIIEKIVQTYSYINPTWLITGKGSMFNDTDPSSDKVKINQNINARINKSSVVNSINTMNTINNTKDAEVAGLRKEIEHLEKIITLSDKHINHLETELAALKKSKSK
jgi:DNA-binding XRE family transcriptional regulator